MTRLPTALLLREGLEHLDVRGCDGVVSPPQFILRMRSLPHLLSYARSLAAGGARPCRKLRLLLEPFVRRRDGADESVAEFMGRRLGRQAVANLVDNGLQASPGEGVVLVTATLEDARWLKLTVTDDGAGIEDEVLARAFEPGFTTRRELGGMGVGLSVSQDIVGRMGGEIELRVA